MIQFQIRKGDLRVTRQVELTNSESKPGVGQIRVAIDRFAVTANNVTYAVTGDQLGYWNFFPPLGEDSDGWGVLPVWGFADVVESRADEIPVGDRVFGFLPAATELTMTPINVSPLQFTENAAHRRELPATYNHYRRVLAEPGYDRATDPERMLLRPLLVTSFCLWESLRDHDWYGAEQIVVLSASSKTSIGLSYALQDAPSAPSVTGLTSARNLDFLQEVGTYQTSLPYDSITSLRADLATVIVDVSGNGELLQELRAHLGDKLRMCVRVGITHWEQAGSGNVRSDERSEFFFAPAHIQKRVAESGSADFDASVSAFLRVAAAKTKDWMKIVKIQGMAGLTVVYSDVCGGRLAANEGLIVELPK